MFYHVTFFLVHLYASGHCSFFSYVTNSSVSFILFISISSFYFVSSSLNPHSYLHFYFSNFSSYYFSSPFIPPTFIFPLLLFSTLITSSIHPLSLPALGNDIMLPGLYKEWPECICRTEWTVKTLS